MKTNHSENTFDLVFVGLGCANSLLLLSLYRQNKLQHLRIAILEPDSKTRNDRTFCFWATDEEIGRYHLQDLISKSWTDCIAGTRQAQSIAPYRYHHISGIDLYNKTRRTLELFNPTRIKDNLVNAAFTDGHYVLHCENCTIRAGRVYDSRPPQFMAAKGIETHLSQSFYGWKIEMENPVFNPDAFVMMDFSVQQSDSTQFVYVLPFDEKNALVECTRFGLERIDQAGAEDILTDYINSRWGNYSIKETETGVIPMSSVQIESSVPGPDWILTGGRAGNIKPSTGYSFLTSCMDAERLAMGVGFKRKPRRYAFYDRLLLSILHKTPQAGKPIFERLFDKIPAKTVLDFLREEVSSGNELRILASLPKGLFIKTAFYDVWFALFSNAFLPLLAGFMLLMLHLNGLTVLGTGVLFAGLLLLGLPHGAVDHLLESGKMNTPVTWAFVVKYLFLSTLMGCLWWLSPTLGLFVFIVYSAWHFGETEFQNSSTPNKAAAFVWGVCLLVFLLFSHPTEFKGILAEMGLPDLHFLPENIHWFAFAVLIVLGWARGFQYFIQSLYLVLTLYLPLLHAFGLYFIFDHSVKSSEQLLRGFQVSWRKLYPRAMPFTMGALLLGAIFYVLNLWNVGGLTGLFFIFLSCLSFPHVLAMNGFYRRKFGFKP